MPDSGEARPIYYVKEDVPRNFVDLVGAYVEAIERWLQGPDCAN